MSNPKAAWQSTELDVARNRFQSPLLLGAAAFAGATSALALAIVILVILSATDQTNEGAAGYLPLAYAALAVIIAVIAVSVFVRRVAISVSRGLAWLVGGVSFVVSFVPWWGLAGGNPDRRAAGAPPVTCLQCNLSPVPSFIRTTIHLCGHEGRRM